MATAAARRIERTGRARVWSASELAELLGVPEGRVTEHCRQAGLLGAGALFFGAIHEGGNVWLIPDRVARRVADQWPLRHYSVARVAELAEVSERQVRARLRVVPAGVPMERGRREYELGARLFFGTQQRVPESELKRLMEGRVVAPPAG